MKKIEATFIGENGSEGFEKGIRYTLTISHKNDSEVYSYISRCIYISHHDTLVPYESLIAFLNNWDNIRNI